MSRGSSPARTPSSSPSTGGWSGTGAGHRAGVISTSDLQVNLTTFMKLDGGTLMWALTREKRWQQSAPHRLRRRFFRRVDTPFRKAGGESTHAELIREQATMPPSAQGR